jgi:sentrin-specific protease 8
LLELNAVIAQFFIAGPEDIQLTTPHQWLNDQCIEYWWDHVIQINPGFQETEDGMTFVCPSVMHMLNFLDDGNFGALNDLKLDRKSLILMPINNNQEISVGGTHWSLLCFLRSGNKFYHFDSCGNMNLECSRRISAKIAQIATVESFSFIAVSDMPRQINGSDCGLYMLLAAELVGRCWIDRKCMPDPSMLLSISPALASDTRSALRFLAQRSMHRDR